MNVIHVTANIWPWGVFKRENTYSQPSVRGGKRAHIYLKFCLLTYISGNSPFPDPNNFHRDSLGHTFGLKCKSNR